VWPEKAFFPERLSCACKYLQQEKAEILVSIRQIKRALLPSGFDIQPMPDGGQAPFTIKFQN